MKKATLIAVILGVLLLVSVVQAFQLNGLKEIVKEGSLTVSSSGNTGAVSSGSSSGKTTSALPASVKNLPTMVGGC